MIIFFRHLRWTAPLLSMLVAGCLSGGGSSGTKTTCASFTYQEDAQANYAPNLDSDNDGKACEALPSRPKQYATVQTSPAAPSTSFTSSPAQNSGTQTNLLASTTFTSSAAIGELLEFTVNRLLLTYSYKVVESAWGLNGQMGSGTLIKNSDGTYTPSEDKNAKLIIGNGVMVGAVTLNFGGTKKTFPFYGLSSLATNLTDVAGTYNFVDRKCLNYNSCTVGYGTIKIEATGNWALCRNSDISTNPTCATDTGSLNVLNNGRFQINSSYMNAWFAIVGADRILVIDTYTAGRGATLVGINQSNLMSGNLNGNWLYYNPTYGVGAKLTVNGNLASIRKADSFSLSPYYTNATDWQDSFSTNTPWLGVLKTTEGGIGISGTNGGLYAYIRPADNYFSYGIKMQ